jgi:hypothetical protein
MNLNINPSLTTTIAADRRRAFALEAEISRTRRNGRLARRAARSAFQANVQASVSATAATPSDFAPGLAPTIATRGMDTARPLVLRSASIAGPIDGAALLASSDLEHASARVA